jgi:hypothetical protein
MPDATNETLNKSTTSTSTTIYSNSTRHQLPSPSNRQTFTLYHVSTDIHEVNQFEFDAPLANGELEWKSISS